MNKCGVVTLFFTFVSLFFFSNQGFCTELDMSKYIPIDQVHTDMQAHCLTVFSGTEVEKFPLKVLSVVRNQQPGHDMILVLGIDGRFGRGTAIHGCSGSPVYIDGRLAGALAAGWDGSLDSLYLVRPIEDMLTVGNTESSTAADNRMSFGFDFSEPLDLKQYYQQSMQFLQNRTSGSEMSLPLSSSLPANLLEQYENAFKGLGFTPVNSGALLPSSSFQDAPSFEKGGVLSLVLCGGDVSLSASGTVTEIIGDQIYGFGHKFRGKGAVNFPIAAGIVHSVVASRSSSFKFSSPGPVLGTLEFDQSNAVRGTIGQMPKTIPLHIEVDVYNDPQVRKYDCYLAVDRDLTPMILQAVLASTAQMQGALPFEHTVRYSGRIDVQDQQPIIIDNLSSGRQINDVATEMYSATGLLLTNPFEEMKINSIDVTMKLEPVNTMTSVWAVNLNRTRVKPGQTITASVVLKSYRAEEKTVTIDFKVPQSLKPGDYKMNIMGAAEYLSFVRKLAPQKFLATNTDSLMSGLTGLFEYRRNRLYAVMQTPSTGLVIREHELGQLPPTKMLLMQDSKRLLPLQPYNDWAESQIELDNIVDGSAEISFTVIN